MGYITQFTLKVFRQDGTDTSPADKEFDQILSDADSIDEVTEIGIEKYKESYIDRVKDASRKLSELPVSLIENLAWIKARDCEMKWYDHEADMKALSKVFKEFVFELDGEGEENGDIWRKWFKGGKMQGGKAKVVMPEFNKDGFK